LLASAELRRAERVGEPPRRAAGLERLGLRLVRRPAVEEQHLEARGDPAGWLGKALAVDLRRTRQGRAPAEAAAALGHQVAFAHRREVAHQGERALVF